MGIKRQLLEIAEAKSAKRSAAWPKLWRQSLAGVIGFSLWSKAMQRKRRPSETAGGARPGGNEAARRTSLVLYHAGDCLQPEDMPLSDQICFTSEAI